MNRERMLELADEIEKPKKLVTLEFDMGDFITSVKWTIPAVTDFIECGTAACIGGWACLLFGEPGEQIDSDTAQRLLDLDAADAGRLFFNNDEFILKTSDGKGRYFSGPQGITRKEAAAAIRRMVNR